MTLSIHRLFLGSLLLVLGAVQGRGDTAATPAYWKFAPTPPMGWNSYDDFGSSVTEDEVMANASYMKDHLLAHGWKYVVVDYRWYDPHPHEYLNPPFPPPEPLNMDANGRLLPAPNRFPSAADGHGFTALADKIHAMGLKFGFHIMRGIPRQAVQANTPIEGSDFHAADAANQGNTCWWNGDMFGVKGDTAAGQAYYDSIFRLYAAWKIDFIKVDDLSKPYSTAEIEAIRQAIDKCGRAIVFSTSPGETPVAEKDHISTHANMWRLSDDFWDSWGALNHACDLAAAWQGVGGPGRWPDLDMLCLGKIGERSVDGPRMTRFTHDEQTTVMSLWALAPSPLMLGMNLPENDGWTSALITNDEVLAVNQDPLGQAAHKIDLGNHLEVWERDLKDGSKAVGLLNRSDNDASVTLDWQKAGLTGKKNLRDLWQHKDLGSFDQTYAATVPKHGTVLLKVTDATP